MKLKELDKFIEDNNLLVDIQEKPGIYAITIDNCIVYVGQSKNIYQRCSQHIYNVENAILNQEKKYLLLLAAKLGGHDIDYKYIEYCDIEDLREREEFHISSTKPILNILTPEGKHDISDLRVGDVLIEVQRRKETHMKRFCL